MSGFATIEDVQRANEAIGHTWFDKASTEYHGSKVETDVIGGHYFVESQYAELGNHDSGRTFRVVAVAPDGGMQYLRSGEKFDSVDAAVAYIETVMSSR
jgi:hypothetical protein